MTSIRNIKNRVVVDFQVFLKEGEHMEKPTHEQITLIMNWYRERAAEVVEDFTISYNIRRKRFRASFKNNLRDFGEMNHCAYDVVRASDCADCPPLMIGPKEYVVEGYIAE